VDKEPLPTPPPRPQRGRTLSTIKKPDYRVFSSLSFRFSRCTILIFSIQKQEKAGDLMNLDQVKEFINQVHGGTLAASDGRKVGVRPMNGLSWRQNQLGCATAALFNNFAFCSLIFNFFTNPDFTYQQAELVK
jgi:hypothetical protein